MKITIYTTNTCKYCADLKNYLKEKGREFIEKMIEVKANESEMASVSGGYLGIPFILIELQDGKKESVIGFDKGKIDSILGQP